MENLSEYDTVYLTAVLFLCTIALVLKATSNLKTKNDVPFLTELKPQVQTDVSSRKTVLIVDDDDVTRLQLGSRLKKLGFNVIEVSDGRSAVELYEKGIRFCLVVMDYEMPDMNGLAAIRNIRQLDREVVIVGSTIHDPAQMQNDFLAAGANLVDIKPISGDRLMEVMNEYNLN